jgi:hypothetical protein
MGVHVALVGERESDRDRIIYQDTEHLCFKLLHAFCDRGDQVPVLLLIRFV